MTDQPKTAAPEHAPAHPATAETRRAAPPRPASPAARAPDQRPARTAAETRHAAPPTAGDTPPGQRPARKAAEARPAGHTRAEPRTAGKLPQAAGAAEARRTGDPSLPAEAKKATAVRRRPPEPRPAKKTAEAPRTAGPAAEAAAGRPAARKASDQPAPPKDKQPAGADTGTGRAPAVELINGKHPLNSDYAGRRFDGKTWTPDLARKYPDGVSFSRDGFPDFAPYAKAGAVIPGLSGNRVRDARLANAAVGLKNTPPGYTWHHHQDGKTMQLIPSDLHDGVRHTGGAAVIKDRNRKAQDS